MKWRFFHNYTFFFSPQNHTSDLRTHLKHSSDFERIPQDLFTALNSVCVELHLPFNPTTQSGSLVNWEQAPWEEEGVFLCHRRQKDVYHCAETFTRKSHKNSSWHPNWRPEHHKYNICTIDVYMQLLFSGMHVNCAKYSRTDDPQVGALVKTALEICLSFSSVRSWTFSPRKVLASNQANQALIFKTWALTTLRTFWGWHGCQAPSFWTPYQSVNHAC